MDWTLEWHETRYGLFRLGREADKKVPGLEPVSTPKSLGWGSKRGTFPSKGGLGLQVLVL
jgi:hypothetical protein